MRSVRSSTPQLHRHAILHILPNKHRKCVSSVSHEALAQVTKCWIPWQRKHNKR